MLMKKAEAEAEAKKNAQAQYLLENYGTAKPKSNTTSTTSTSNLNPSTTTASKPKAITSTSTYVEYTSSGIPKTSTKSSSIARSKYPEDIHPNNHTSIFGSWWHNFTWGYACCHSTVRNSYCTGEEGKVAFAEAEGRRLGNDLLAIEGGEGQGGGEAGDGSAGKEKEDEASREKEKEKEKAATTREDGQKDKKKRTIHEIQSGISEEDMEQYKRSKLSAQDPMAAMLGRDELVEG